MTAKKAEPEFKLIWVSDLSDAELCALLDSTEQGLTGRPVSSMAAEEIARRERANAS
jgi:hypothetical protein